jgi:hypothetical protein
LENLPVEFKKLQNLVELDLFHCSKLRCLPDTSVNLSQLKRFGLQGCHKLQNLALKFEKFKA